MADRSITGPSDPQIGMSTRVQKGNSQDAVREQRCRLCILQLCFVFVAHNQVLQVGFIPSMIDGKETRQKEEDFFMTGLVLAGSGLNPRLRVIS